MTLDTIGTPTLYLGFTLLVAVLLAVDFVVLKAQGSHRVGVKEAAGWTVVWIADRARVRRVVLVVPRRARRARSRERRRRWST